MTCFKKGASGEFHGSGSHLLKLNWNTSLSDLPFSKTGRQVFVAVIIHARFRTEPPFAFSHHLGASG